MKQSLRNSILIFILVHFFAGLAWSQPAPEIKPQAKPEIKPQAKPEIKPQITEGLLYYTDRFGARTSVPIEDIADIHHKVFQIPVPEGTSSDLQEQIRLRNLELSWIEGKHFVRVGREVIEIDLAQSIEIVRARQIKNDPLHPNTYLTDQERTYLNLKLNEVRKAILAKRKDMDSQIPGAEKRTVTTEIDTVVAEGVQKSGSVWALVLDGIPYFLNNRDDGNLMAFNFRNGGQPNRADVRSREVLACNLPTTPPVTPDNRIRLQIQGDTRTFYSNLEGNLSINHNPAQRVIVANTATGNAFCTTGPSERIFSNGFESGGVQ